ncbi:hypothetical protein CBS147339_9468 [Penicillium roqueforti]|nr:hypothetical protein DTO012A8_7482 [Penicillium roqueforti]KAI3064242.1 hypothetical protein CBS147339_9468 [Penicillium roqueforti]KAI3090578.1 hypothetical protein CBS147338_8840 [Penicillium roqueforti]KAI3176347.1 hypothetical protein DTO032C6_9651 [Penicillium roqueforti]KAI3226264.1 hypothetical protein DTO012A9_9353 [Penicillium roqueforti]
MNQLASEAIKVNNTVLEEIGKRVQVLRHFPQPGQRSAASSFPERDLVSVESPAILSTAGADTYFLDGFAVETQDPKVQGSTKRRSATKRSSSKNKLWPPHVLKQLPGWFEDQVQRNFSQDEIAQHFEEKFEQKRTFNALEAMLYKLIGKSPYRKRGKRSSVSSRPRQSSPPHHSSSSLDLFERKILRSNIDVHTLHLAPSILPYIVADNSEDENPVAHPDAQPIDLTPESSNSEVVLEYGLVNGESGCLGASQGHMLQPGQCPETEEPSKDLPDVSDMMAEAPWQLEDPDIDNSIHAIEADLRRGGSHTPQGPPVEVAPMQMNQSALSQGSRPDNTSGQGLVDPLNRVSLNENTQHEPEDFFDASSLARTTTPSQTSQPNRHGSSTEDHPLNCGNSGTSANFIEGGLAEEEIVRRCLLERSQSQTVRLHRPWRIEVVNQLPQWLMTRKHLSKDRLEVEFLRDFKHYRTSSAISAACRKKRKAEARQNIAPSSSSPILQPRAVSVASDAIETSRMPNTIASQGTSSLNPSYLSSKEMSAPENSPLERYPQRTQQQIPEDREGSFSNHSFFSHGDQEAVDTIPPASVASSCAPAQTPVSQHVWVADDILGMDNPNDPSLAQSIAVNDGNALQTRLNVESTTPQAQLERGYHGALNDGERGRQTSTPPEVPVGQESNDQNGARRPPPKAFGEGQAWRHDRKMADSTLEATGDQSYLPAVDTRRPQLEISPNLQTTPQVQAKPVTVPSANNSRTFHITKQIQDDSSGFQASSPGVDFRRAHKAQSPTQPNPQMGWVWAQFSGPPMGRGPIGL